MFGDGHSRTPDAFSLGVNCPVSITIMLHSGRCTVAMHLSSTIPPRCLKSKSRCRMPDTVGLESGRLNKQASCRYFNCSVTSEGKYLL